MSKKSEHKGKGGHGSPKVMTATHAAGNAKHLDLHIGKTHRGEARDFTPGKKLSHKEEYDQR